MWREAWKLGLSLWSNGVALQETAFASQEVIARRSETIGTALRNPLDADVAEFSRMVTEKVSAWGEAGSALATDWMAINAELFSQGNALAAAFTFGEPPNLAAIGELGERGMGLALTMSNAGGRALRPLHAAVTANQRRLARRG